MQLQIVQAYKYETDNVINNEFKVAYQEPPQFNAQAFASVQVFVQVLRELDKKALLSYCGQRISVVQSAGAGRLV